MDETTSEYGAASAFLAHEPPSGPVAVAFRLIVKLSRCVLGWSPFTDFWNRRQAVSLYERWTKPVPEALFAIALGFQPKVRIPR